MPRTGFSLGNARALLPPPSGASHLLLSMKTSPGWRPGGSPALFYRASNPACAGRGRAPSPVPPGATPTIVHRPGSQESVASWSLHGHHCLTRAAGDPHQNPQSKMKWSTSGAFHLILSMQYHLTRRARSREVRLLGGRVPFAFFASSRSSRLRVRWRSLAPHQDPQHKVKRSTSATILNYRLSQRRRVLTLFYTLSGKNQIWVYSCTRHPSFLPVQPFATVYSTSWRAGTNRSRLTPLSSPAPVRAHLPTCPGATGGRHRRRRRRDLRSW